MTRTPRWLRVRRRPVESSRVRFERRAAAVRQRPWRVVGVALAIVALVAGLGWLVGASDVLAAREVRVDGAAVETDVPTITETAAVPLGRPLARIDTGAIAARVKTLPVVRDVTVGRAWPHTVVVSVSPRLAFLAVRKPDATVTLVDDELVEFRSVTAVPPGVPVANGPDGPPSREALETVRAVLRVLPASLRSTVSEISLTSASLVSFKLGGVQVVWGGLGQEDKKVKVLQALLSTNPKVIDVSAPDTPITR